MYILCSVFNATCYLLRRQWMSTCGWVVAKCAMERSACWCSSEARRLLAVFLPALPLFLTVMRTHCMSNTNRPAASGLQPRFVVALPRNCPLPSAMHFCHTPQYFLAKSRICSSCKEASGKVGLLWWLARLFIAVNWKSRAVTIQAVHD